MMPFFPKSIPHSVMRKIICFVLALIFVFLSFSFAFADDFDLSYSMSCPYNSPQRFISSDFGVSCVNMGALPVSFNYGLDSNNWLVLPKSISYPSNLHIYSQFSEPESISTLIFILPAHQSSNGFSSNSASVFSSSAYSLNGTLLSDFDLSNLATLSNPLDEDVFIVREFVYKSAGDLRPCIYSVPSSFNLHFTVKPSAFSLDMLPIVSSGSTLDLAGKSFLLPAGYALCLKMPADTPVYTRICSMWTTSPHDTISGTQTFKTGAYSLDSDFYISSGSFSGDSKFTFSFSVPPNVKTGLFNKTSHGYDILLSGSRFSPYVYVVNPSLYSYLNPKGDIYTVNNSPLRLDFEFGFSPTWAKIIPITQNSVLGSAGMPDYVEGSVDTDEQFYDVASNVSSGAIGFISGENVDDSVSTYDYDTPTYSPTSNNIVGDSSGIASIFAGGSSSADSLRGEASSFLQTLRFLWDWLPARIVTLILSALTLIVIFGLVKVVL